MEVKDLHFTKSKKLRSLLASLGQKSINFFRVIIRDLITIYGPNGGQINLDYQKYHKKSTKQKT